MRLPVYSAEGQTLSIRHASLALTSSAALPLDKKWEICATTLTSILHMRRVLSVPYSIREITLHIHVCIGCIAAKTDLNC